ncbi:hypothetical protein [Acinetobacter bereziniae]|uniref:hypothetical protein n=1 Tax=Acinetobacter bereziniae TaxID=106648 RepID=UPI0015D9739A|nr:hypothetical protein [Acinetobacter bereziniae]
MKIHSVEKHQRIHLYRFEQKDLERLALEKVAAQLGLDLSKKNLVVESRIITRSNGINPTIYECEVSIIENLDCKD